MSRKLIIYDEAGYILDVQSGQPAPREPQGVPFLWVDIPIGKQTKSIGEVGVDTTLTPHQVILEDVPPTEIDNVRAEMNETAMELTMLIAQLGGM